jgi:hypothetical protein
MDYTSPQDPEQYLCWTERGAPMAFPTIASVPKNDISWEFCRPVIELGQRSSLWVYSRIRSRLYRGSMELVAKASLALVEDKICVLNRLQMTATGTSFRGAGRNMVGGWGNWFQYSDLRKWLPILDAVPQIFGGFCKARAAQLSSY